MDKIDQCSPNDYKRKERLERKLQFAQTISKVNILFPLDICISKSVNYNAHRQTRLELYPKLKTI